MSNKVTAKTEIVRLKDVCSLLFSHKVSLNRHKFAIYSEKLKRFEYLYHQKDFGSEYRQLFSEIKTLV